MDFYDDKDELLGDIPLSENQVEQLRSGVPLFIQYRTPQLLRGGAHGDHAGTFELTMAGERIRTDDAAAAADCIKMLQRIRSSGNGQGHDTAG